MSRKLSEVIHKEIRRRRRIEFLLKLAAVAVVVGLVVTGWRFL